jgi:hypothetical protein
VTLPERRDVLERLDDDGRHEGEEVVAPHDLQQPGHHLRRGDADRRYILTIGPFGKDADASGRMCERTRMSERDATEWIQSWWLSKISIQPTTATLNSSVMSVRFHNDLK